MKLHFAPIAIFLAFAATAAALPAPTGVAFLAKRQYKLGNIPYFPQEIPSCVACEPEWTSISSCARAAAAFKDWKQMLFNPVSFVDAIKCACTDTFSSAYPQCVDCFVQTNQCEEYLGVPSLEANSSSIFDGTPNQGYPTATSTGVGGMDYGSAEGVKSGAARLKNGLLGAALSVVVCMAGVMLL